MFGLLFQLKGSLWAEGFLCAPTCLFEVNLGNRSWDSSAAQTEIQEGASQPNYLVLQSLPLPSRQKWISSLYRGEQQIEEISPNNHWYLFRTRKADIYHRVKDSNTERIGCVAVHAKNRFMITFIYLLSFDRKKLSIQKYFFDPIIL